MFLFGAMPGNRPLVISVRQVDPGNSRARKFCRKQGCLNFPAINYIRVIIRKRSNPALFVPHGLQIVVTYFCS